MFGLLQAEAGLNASGNRLMDEFLRSLLPESLLADR